MGEPVVDYDPADVVLGTPPLGATMQKCETECAAGVLVRILQVRGEGWGAIRLKDMGRILDDQLNAQTEPIASWGRNPFFRPDFQALLKQGYAAEIGDTDDTRSVVFTDKGFEAMRRWVRRKEDGNG